MCPQITADSTFIDFLDYVDSYLWENTKCLRVGWTGTRMSIIHVETRKNWFCPLDFIIALYEGREHLDKVKEDLRMLAAVAMPVVADFKETEVRIPDGVSIPYPTFVGNEQLHYLAEDVDMVKVLQDANIEYNYRSWLGMVCAYILTKYEYNSVKMVKCSPDEHLDEIDENYGILCTYSQRMNLGLGIDAVTLRSIYKECKNSAPDWQLKIDQTLHYRLLSIIESHYVTNSGVVS